MRESVFIEGDKVSLLPVENEHAILLCKWANDHRVRRLGRSILPKSHHMMEEYIIKQNDSEKMILLMIYHRKDGALIGDINLQAIDYYNRNAWIEITIGEIDYWGKGLGTESAKLIIKYAFNEMNLHKIYAEISALNIGSQKAVEKIGMTKEANLKDGYYIDGRYRDVYIYSVLESDFEGNFLR